MPTPEPCPVPDALTTLWDERAAPGPRPPLWAERVRSLDPADRRAMLDRSDSAAAGNDADQTVAMAVVTALAADLDPADPADCARIARLIADGPAYSHLGLMERTAAGAADAETGHCARLVLAQRDLIEGRVAAAERTYVEALRTSTDRWPVLRSSAAVGYARLCLDQRRDLEALVLSRRGSEACAEAGDASGALFGRIVEAYVLCGLEDWPRLADAIRALEARLPAASDPVRQSIEYGVAGLAADLAIGEGRFADAVTWIERAAESARRRREKAWSPAEANLIRAAAADAEGRPEGALAEIEHAIALPEDDEGLALHLRTWRVRLLLRLGRDAGDAADEWLARLGASRTLGAGRTLRSGLEGGEALRASGLHADRAARALRLAAAAALARLAEIECFVCRFPEYAVPTAGEREIIADHRHRTEARERALRDAISRLLADESRKGRWRFATMAPEGGLVACCAWCASLRNRDGAWVPLPEMLLSLPDDAVPLTHTICSECMHTVCPAG